MEPVVTVAMYDSLSCESVAVDVGSVATAATAIEQRLVDADHPRCDFRGRALRYELTGAEGTPLADSQMIPVGTTLTLTSAQAADIKQRRDQWLADLEAGDKASASISRTTHLALIERTRSRLADTERLRKRIIVDRPPIPATQAGQRPRRVALSSSAVVLLALVVGLGAWVLLGRSSEPASGGGETAAITIVGDQGETVVDGLPAELELSMTNGEDNRTVFSGQEGQDITILMLAPPGRLNRRGLMLDPELELFDADGNQIGYNDDRLDFQNLAGGRAIGDGSAQLNSRIDITLPADGEYTVASGDLSRNGSWTYTLIIEQGGPGGDGFNGVGNGPGDFDFDTRDFDQEAVEDAVEDEAVPGRPVVTTAAPRGP